MSINITGHHVELTDALQSYVKDRFERINRHFPQIHNVQITLTVEKLQQKAEATVHVPKGNIHAESQAEDMYAAIDLLIDKLDRQVIKHKEKLQDRSNGEDVR